MDPVEASSKDLTNLEEEKSFHEALHKRLKMLRKKLAKMENYPMDDLNPDQIQALERKPLISFAIKELEELSKQLPITLTKAREQAQKLNIASNTKKKKLRS